jgi:uncharacterized repeat protein (TIGR01451 family)
MAIAVDGGGSAYVTGFTQSLDFPTENAVQPAMGRPGGQNAFVAKLNPAGSALLYSTYLGGSGDEDQGNGIAIDGQGNAYVTGATSSADFPIVNALQSASAFPERQDAFVSKLNTAGSTLIYSTYLGGGDSDVGTGIAVDDLGNAYVTGWTASFDFPTENPLRADKPGAVSAFVTKLKATGSALAYSTYLGGGGFTQSYGIAVDGLGNAYVTGSTDSADFPIANPWPGHQVTFVTKLNPAGSALLYATSFGGGDNNTDMGNGIVVDRMGNAYVTGSTQSRDFPPPATRIGRHDAFVVKIATIAGLQVLMSGPDTVRAGEDLTYDLTVSNFGPDAAQAVTVNVDIPPGAAFVAEIQGDGPSFRRAIPSPGATGPVTWWIANLIADSSAVFHLIVQANSDTPTGAVIRTTANLSSATPNPRADSNSATVTTTIEASVDSAPPATNDHKGS